MPSSILKLGISRNSEMEFFQNFLIYKKGKILYSEIDGIAYLHTRTRHRFYGVPTGTIYSYVVYIRTRGVVHKVSFSGEHNKEIFGKFVGAVDVLVKPFVMVNLLLDFIKNNKLEIGDLTITPEGLYQKRTWPMKKSFLPWNRYYNSIITNGHVSVLRQNDKKKYANFYSPLMSSINAVLLPDLINFIFSKNGVLDENTKKEIIDKKIQLMTASVQDAMRDLSACPKCGEKMIEEAQKFCRKCGLQLIMTN